MDSENRNKRDLPEVVADILITLDKVLETQQVTQQTMAQMQQAMVQMQQTQQTQYEQLTNSFDRMTLAVLDAMDRQTARYGAVEIKQRTQDKDVAELRRRVARLEQRPKQPE